MIARRFRIYLGSETRVKPSVFARIQNVIDELQCVDFYLLPNLALAAVAMDGDVPVERGLSGIFLGRFTQKCPVAAIAEELSYAIERVCPPVVVPQEQRNLERGPYVRQGRAPREYSGEHGSVGSALDLGRWGDELAY